MTDEFELALGRISDCHRFFLLLHLCSSPAVQASPEEGEGALSVTGSADPREGAHSAQERMG